MRYEVILVGNPNTGKTTLFNTLTGSNEKASNWHGVTVSVISKKVTYKSNQFNIYDIPGIYGLNGNSIEEKNAIKFLNSNKDKIIINICDANNLEHNFRLTQKLIEAGFKVVIAVNMANEIRNYNYDKLSTQIGVPIIEIDARKYKTKQQVFEFINKYAYKIKSQKAIKTNKIPHKINEILNNCKLKQYKNPYHFTNIIDKIVLNKFVFPLIFLLSFFVIFYITFGPVGSFISNAFSYFISCLFDGCYSLLCRLDISHIVKVFINEGLFSSMKIICQFLPQIVIMTILFNLLEDVGFMSRVAFMLDGIMSKFGITGKSIFSIMLGYGCTATAVLTTKNLQDVGVRKRTILLTPLASCSAKLPIFLVIFSLFFERYKYIFVLILYIFALFLMFVYALIINKIAPSRNNFSVSEMPKYRLPYIKKIALDSLSVCKSFVFKVGLYILLFGSLIWFMKNFSFSFKFLDGANFDSSILYNVSKLFLPIFSLIGLSNVGVISSLFFGLIAKELIVVSLASMNGVTSSVELLAASLLNCGSPCYFDFNSSIIFVIFVLLYSPCLSALATIKSEIGSKFAFKVFLFQTIIAFSVCFVVRLFLTHLHIMIFLFFSIFIAIAFYFMLKWTRNKFCCGVCYGCKRFHCEKG